MANIKSHNEVSEAMANGWTICFQRCTYYLDDDSTEEGFRFIWRRPNGTLQAARGQARIPNEATLQLLLEKAKSAGWYFMD
ncbi:hypothetical protein [Abditibacterium utsteinense]|uniref:hypothetical protein n=1 Tax=Abditibacterium utsteinense TaxID=1960156 RepID=UPI001931092A|nr:hypothetical protein [Abditibacterium utsteinense]